jgi:thymidylate kinase
MLVTFSGLDGSGKSTLIAHLRKGLEDLGVPVVDLAMYGQVSISAIVRMIHDQIKKTFCKEPKTGTPAAIDTHQAGDTSASAPYVARAPSFLRHRFVKWCVLILDLLVLCLFRLYHEAFQKRVLILDRYFYDLLVDVSGDRHWLYVKVFMLIVPRPTLPIFLAVSPAESFARKGEHSIAYLEHRHKAYTMIFQWVRCPVYIPNADLQQTKQMLEEAVLNCLNLPGR